MSIDWASTSQLRELLFCTRIQFTPETQPLRETALDRIVEQAFAFGDLKQGSTLQELEEQGAFSPTPDQIILRSADLKDSVQRLFRNGRLESVGDHKRARFRLSEAVAQKIRNSETEAQDRLTRVIDILFPDSDVPTEKQLGTFVDCLAFIFWSLSGAYVRTILGERPEDASFLQDDVISESVRKARNRNHFSFNEKELRRGVAKFFNTTDPEFDLVKWNFAQNYYIARTLGLDPAVDLLSEDYFRDSVFYLDTNVVITALVQSSRHHHAFQKLTNACRRFGIKLRFTHATLGELSNVLSYYEKNVPDAFERLPAATIAKITGIFFETYKAEIEKDSTAEFQRIFSDLYQPSSRLRTLYDAIEIDDPWFDIAKDDVEIKNIAYRIRLESQKRQGRNKSYSAAIHDAILVRWVEEERSLKSKTWILSLDGTLMSAHEQDYTATRKPLALSLDAFLQWVSPLSPEDDVNFSEIFAQSLRYQILPQGKIFTVGDFRIFNELDISCRDFPPTDVEECVQSIQRLLPNLDPSKAEDRERLYSEVKKFLDSPDRQYKQDLHNLKDKLEATERLYKNERENLRSAMVSREGEVEGLRRELLAARDNAELAELHAQKTRQTLRLILSVATFLLLTLVALGVVAEFGEGQTLGHKIIDVWEVVVTLEGAAIAIIGFIHGQEVRAVFEKYAGS